jgi:hypothetical protein
MTIINHQPQGDIVTKQTLNEGEENILKSRIGFLKLQGDFSGAGVCQLGTIYSLIEKI